MQNKIIFSKWSDEEIIKLFKFVETQKQNFLPLSEIFERYALQSKRKANSIRNYYYKQIDDFKRNPECAKKLNINMLKHGKQNFEHFSERDSENLVEQINQLISLGHSVRSACLKLSNNNPKLMMRYQNKYQLLKSRHNGTKVLKFPQNKLNKSHNNETISDTDINNLFLGLVKVIKRSVMEQANKELISECEWANDTLRKTLVNLSNKETQIKSLNLKNTILSKRVLDLQNEVYRLCKNNKEK